MNEYEVGDYLIIYCGRDEGCCFTVRAKEKRDGRWWYDTGAYGWRAENTISTEHWYRLTS